MSSYLVQQEVIAGISKFIYYFRDIYGGLKNILDKHDFDKSDDDFVFTFGESLYRLNLEALKERYGDDPKEYKKYNPDFYPDFSIIETIKHLQCLEYQCSEGNIPEKHLFKLIEELISYFMMVYIEELEEYKEARWGTIKDNK